MSPPRKRFLAAAALFAAWVLALIVMAAESGRPPRPTGTADPSPATAR